jgi:hypothetical protein
MFDEFGKKLFLIKDDKYQVLNVIKVLNKV